MSKLINLYHIKSLNVLLAFLFYFNPFFLLNLNSQEIKPLKRVVIDAGHGGKDSGTMGTKRYKTYEKDIALKISLLRRCGPQHGPTNNSTNVTLTKKMSKMQTYKNAATRQSAGSNMTPKPRNHRNTSTLLQETSI